MTIDGDNDVFELEVPKVFQLFQAEIDNLKQLGINEYKFNPELIKEIKRLVSIENSVQNLAAIKAEIYSLRQQFKQQKDSVLNNIEGNEYAMHYANAATKEYMATLPSKVLQQKYLSYSELQLLSQSERNKMKNISRVEVDEVGNKFNVFQERFPANIKTTKEQQDINNYIMSEFDVRGDGDMSMYNTYIHIPSGDGDSDGDNQNIDILFKSAILK